MLRRLYDWTMSLAAGRHAPAALAAVSFAESSFFPIPPDVMLIPMILARRARAWFFAALATASSVIGGIFGYMIGYFLFEAIGMPILNFYHGQDAFAEFAKLFADYGVWIIIIKGMTPIPYKILTIAAGVAHMELIPFILASILARALRFFIVAALLYFFGEPIRKFIEERLTLVTTVFVALLVGGFIAVKFLV
jgi:membrane protein YqaA with SNARE-associated domain